MERRFRRVLSRPEDVILVAEKPPAGIIGWLHGVERGTLESDKRCEILGLVLDSARSTSALATLVKTSHIYRKPISR